jgi:hypothetical protein
MTEVTQYTFSYKEIAEVLIEHQDIHEGIWGIIVEFGIHAANIGPSDDSLLPTALIPILKIGLQKSPKETSLAVDASKINPISSKQEKKIIHRKKT